MPRAQPPTDAPTRRPRGRNVPLLAAGLLFLAAPFALVNPGFGVLARAWPWEAYGSAADLQVRVLAGLWGLTGLLAVLFSIAGPVRLRALSVTTLLALLVCVLPDAALSPFTLLPAAWQRILAFSLLGAGLWLARTGSRRTQARAFAAAGGLFLLWGSLGTGPTSLSATQDPARNLGFLLASCEQVFSEQGAGLAFDSPFWSGVLPNALLLLVGVFGLLVGLGLRLPRLSGAACALLLLASAAGGLVSAFAQPDATALGILSEVSARALAEGYFLGLVGIFALADLARSRPGQDDLGVGL